MGIGNHSIIYYHLLVRTNPGGYATFQLPLLYFIITVCTYRPYVVRKIMHLIWIVTWKSLPTILRFAGLQNNVAVYSSTVYKFEFLYVWHKVKFCESTGLPYTVQLRVTRIPTFWRSRSHKAVPKSKKTIYCSSFCHHLFSNIALASVNATLWRCPVLWPSPPSCLWLRAHWKQSRIWTLGCIGGL